MKIRLILLFAMFACNAAHAGYTPKLSDSYTKTNETAPALNSSLMPAPRYGGGGYNPISMMLSAEWGRTTNTVSTDSVSYKGKADLYRVGLGVKVLLPNSDYESSKYFTVSLAYTFLVTKYNYPKNGKDVGTGGDIQCVSLPATIGFAKKRGKVGFYGQAGLTLNYNIKEKPSANSLIWNYHKLWIDPSVSFGLFADIVASSRGVEYKPHRVTLGPYVGYTVNNLSAEANVGLRVLQIGLRLSSALF